MAITKEEVIVKIEVVGIHKCVQVATDVVIKEDNNEISRTRSRYGLTPFISEKNGSTWTHTETDISSEATEVQAVCNAVWNDTLKTAYKAKMEE